MNEVARKFTPAELADHFGPAAEIQEVPCNIAAEKALLGAILVNNEALDALRVPIEATHFYLPIHREIFSAASDLCRAGRKANPVTLKTYISDEMIGGKTISQYLASLAVDAVNIINAPDYAMAIMDAAARRACISLSQKLEQTAFSKELDIMDEFEALKGKFDDVVKALQGGSDGAGISGSDALDRAFLRMERAVNGDDEVGIDCGFEPVRQLIGRMTPGQLIILGGSTKQGKSGLARQLGLGAARNGVPCFDYSGEMGADELAMRELSRITKISVSRQKEGNVSPHERGQLFAAKNELRKLPWQIVDRRRTLPQFAREFSAFVKKHGHTIGIVDSVTLFDTDKASYRLSKYEFAEYVTDGLKALARDTGSPIIALAQLKKNTFAVEKGYNKKVDAQTFRNVVARRPRASDLFGACERDADHVLIPFNPMPILEDIEPAEGSDDHILWEGVRDEYEGKAEIILALSRERRPSRRSVRWDGETTSFLPMQDYAQQRML